MGERDPQGLDQHDYGAKLDHGKPDASLLLMFGHALRAVSEVGTFGARKYTRGGWQGVDDGRTRYTAALLRHLLEEHYEVLDPDSGLLHAAHTAWNALARLEIIIRGEKEFESAYAERTDNLPQRAENTVYGSGKSDSPAAPISSRGTGEL